MSRTCFRISACLLAFAWAAHAQSSLSDRVLVVYDPGQRESREVAFHYLAKRGIPKTNTCKISPSSTDQIKQDEFDARVKEPLRKCLEAAGRDKILYIVFTYKTPWLLEMGPQTNALDQFVADIWDEYLPERAANPQEVQPYFGIAQSEGDLYQPFVSLADYRVQPNAKHIYSVWRLDAPTAALASGLVDQAMDAEAKGLAGNACFDRRTDPTTAVSDFAYGAGDWDIHQAAELARRAGFPVVEDGHAEEFGTAPAPLRCDHAALYAGWYALNHYNDAFTWNPGAIGIHLDSASATNPRGGPNWAANALAHGITITAGATTEPYLDNLPHPDQMLFYLFRGATIGDALLRSERLLKWRIINVGDPLYRPFPNPAAMAPRIRPPIILALLPQFTVAGSQSTAAIVVSRPAGPGGITFSIKTDHTELAHVPAKATIPEGTDIIKFPVNAGQIQGDNATARIFVEAGELKKSNTLVIVRSKPAEKPAAPAPAPKP